MLTLHLVRHAATQANLQKRYPLPTEDAPILPTAALPHLPRGLKAYTAPSLRAHQTALACHYAHAEVCEQLSEADFGVMAGHTWAELEARYGEAPQQWISHLQDPSSDLGPPQGETGRRFHARLNQWLRLLPAHGDVIAFTHAGPIWAILRLTLGHAAVAVPPACWLTLQTLQHSESPTEWWLTRVQPVPCMATQQ